MEHKIKRLVRLNIRADWSKEDMHEYLKQRFKFPDYYGANWDALYDVLTELGYPTKVILRLPKDQGPIIKDFLEVLLDAQLGNPSLEVELRTQTEE